MSETKSAEKNKPTINGDDLLAEEAAESPEHVEPQQRGLGDALRQFFRNAQRQRTPVSKRDMSQDRARPLVLLIAGIVGSVLLFLGVFSTPPARPGQMERDRGQPNLGRRDSSSTARVASVTPLLTAEVHSDDLGHDGLSAADIESTSRRDAFSYNDRESALPECEGSAGRLQPLAGGPVDADRGIPVYRRDETTGSITYGSGTSAPYASLTQTQPDRPYSVTFNRGAAASDDAVISTPSPAAAEPSIVYVRQTPSTMGQPPVAFETTRIEMPALLPPGSRLIARLESAVTSALKTPVIAAIEYNYFGANHE